MVAHPPIHAPLSCPRWPWAWAPWQAPLSCCSQPAGGRPCWRGGRSWARMWVLGWAGWRWLAA